MEVNVDKETVQKKKTGKKTISKKRISKKERERINQILELLDKHYSTNVTVYLNHDNPWQLLIATILSAQCTDDRVNMVTKKLFKKYRSLEDFANADLKELEKDIYSTGFYHNKAKNIIACSKKLILEFGGEVPSDIEALTSLPGVGRKTANVIRGNIFKIPSIVVDTHVKRISNKLGFTNSQDPDKVIAHGRSICIARNPKCKDCFLNTLCKSPQLY
jgi:endonuclease III